MRSSFIPFLLGALLTGAIAAGVFLTLPQTNSGNAPATRSHEDGKEHHDEHSEGEHAEGEHDLIKLDEQARRVAGIRTEPARFINISDQMTVPGVVEIAPNNGAKITPPIAGKIVRLMVNLGDTVKAGQTLVVLDSFEVAQAHASVKEAESELRQAEAALKTAQASVSQARAGVLQAKAEVQQARVKQKNAEAALKQQRELAKTGAFSQPALQAAQTEVNDAQSELLQAQTELQAHLSALQRAERLFREELISRAELEQAQAELRQDQTRLEKAKARIEIAKKTLEREQKINQSDLLTKQALQSAEAEVRSTQSEVQKAIQGLARAQQDVLKAQKEEQAARTTIQGAAAKLAAAKNTLMALEGSGHVEGSGGYIRLTAPIGGVIAESHATLGQAVERSSELFVIENLGAVLVDANVPEKEIARVRPGQSAVVTVASFPNERFSGVVQSVANRIDEKTRTLTVRVLVENKSGHLKPEMFAKVRLQNAGKGTQLAVPLSALETDGAQKFIYVEEEGGFERRAVQVGNTNGAMAQIIEGVEPGERVVIEGVFVLKSERQKSELKGHEH